MKPIARIATVLLLSALLLLAFRFSRFYTNSSLASRGTNVVEETVLVMPPVSDEWSKVTVRTSPTRATLARPAAAREEIAPQTDGLNSDQVRSRASELLARAAVESVGIDPDADQYFVAAINDPFVPAEDRQELISALSHAGISDFPTAADDLPLVATRLALVEQLSPIAIDQANSSALQQVYSELLEVFTTLTAPEESALAGTNSVPQSE